MKSSLLLIIYFAGFFGALALPTKVNAATSAECVVAYFHDLLSNEGNTIISNAELNRSGKVSQTGKFKLEEIGIITHSNHPEVQKVIEELRQEQGELRLLESKDVKTGEILKGRSYFHYDTSLHIPYIAGDPFISLEDLKHERAHFLDWKNERDKLLKLGLKGEALERELQETRKNALFKAHTEANAIAAQLKVRGREQRRLGLKRGPSEQYPRAAIPALPLKDFIRLNAYPQIHALSHRFDQLLKQNLPLANDAVAVSLMDKALRKAFLLRRAAFRRAKAQLLDRDLSAERRTSLESYASSMEDLSGLFDEMFERELHKFQYSGTEDFLRSLYEERKRKVVKELWK